MSSYCRAAGLSLARPVGSVAGRWLWGGGAACSSRGGVFLPGRGSPPRLAALSCGSSDKKVDSCFVLALIQHGGGQRPRGIDSRPLGCLLLREASASVTGVGSVTQPAEALLHSRLAEQCPLSKLLSCVVLRRHFMGKLAPEARLEVPRAA